MDKPYLSLIIPAYNEQQRIGQTLSAVAQYLDQTGWTYEIIAVNDGSTDKTHELMLEAAANLDSLRIISYQPNHGKGYAVRQGVFASRGEYVGFSDADLSAPIDELPKLFAAMEKGYDVAVGSRAVKGAQIETHQPLYRELGGKALNLVIRLLAVPGIHDTQCGFKLFRGDVARRIFSLCFVDGWSFDVEVLYLARRLGYKVAEIPVRWSHAADSKIRPFRAGLQLLWDIVRIRTRHRF
ncbi:MAG: glycosyltransferase family 2 protein [Armatimonadota bacterium]|nr:glycosyltransferase family 2 protein [Armatimonadota bacterium]